MWLVLFGSIGLVVALAAGLTAWLVWPEQNRRPFDEAVKNLAAAKGVHYRSSSAGGVVTWDARVTSHGETIGAATLAGQRVGMLTVGGRTYLTSADGELPGVLGSDIRPAAVRGKWVTGDTGSYAPVLAQALSPAKLAGNLRRSLDRTTRFPADDPATSIDGVPALRARTPSADLYVSKNAPYQVLRLVPGDAASRLPPTPRLPRVAPAMDGTGQVVAAVEPSQPPASGPGEINIDPMSAPEVDKTYQDLSDNAKKLSDSVDTTIDFQLRGGKGDIACGPAGCTVTATVTTSVSASGTGGGTVRGGTVTAVLTATVTINGLPAGGCTRASPMPLNGTRPISCGNSGAGAVYTQADAAAKARAHAAAAPGSTYTWTVNSRATIQILARAQVNIEKLVNDLENKRTRAAETAALPKLTGSIAESFEGGKYTIQTFKAGTTFYRAEGAGQGIGSFFGFGKPATAADAEKMYNIAKWGNNADVVTTYRLTQDTTFYTGQVAGGTGRQALLPRGTDAGSVFQQVGQESLP